MMQQSLNVYSIAVPKSTSSEYVKWRQQQLSKLLRDTKGQLSERDHETDMIKFEINTGDKLRKKQAARRISYGVCQECKRSV